MTKKRASVASPSIQSIIEGLYRFKTHKQASVMLQKIRSCYEISAKLQKESSDILVLWIKDYSVEAVQKSKGYKGNYAEISIVEQPGFFTLHAKRLDIALKYHPQRDYSNRGFVNWGHYVLRNINRKKIYETRDVAFTDMLKLHSDFPTTSILNKNRLFIMIYGSIVGEGGESAKNTKAKKVQKYVLELKQVEGGFIIETKENKMKPSTKTPAGSKEEVVGYFTSMVKAKAKKPKK